MCTMVHLLNFRYSAPKFADLVLTKEMERKRHSGQIPTCSTSQSTGSTTATSIPAVLLAESTNAAMEMVLERLFPFSVRRCSRNRTDYVAAFRSVNIPWSESGMNDADYIYAFQRIVMPIAHEFNPDFVIGRL